MISDAVKDAMQIKEYDRILEVNGISGPAAQDLNKRLVL